MRAVSGMVRILAVAAFATGGLAVQAQTGNTGQALTEDYVRAPMPPGFQVVISELEGPVFADASGKTLYRWPVAALRNGPAGEQKGKPTCDDHVNTVNAGLLSPYPPGLELPEVATRPSCTQVWPPVLAPADAKAVGDWSIVERKDGRKQWAYEGQALYTSVLDRGPGDALGGTNWRIPGEAGAVRHPVGPDPNIPPQFAVRLVMTGRLLMTSNRHAVYVWDKDGPNRSNCAGACLQEWAPVLAPEIAASQDWSSEWSVVERSPGVKQWAFRKKPLYSHPTDSQLPGFEGSDQPGWHNVYTQQAPSPPKGFTAQDSQSGQLLADARGRTIYVYYCVDDATDQLACDHPDAPQAYRFAICGRGDPALCVEKYPYVIAPKDAASGSKLWGVMDVDPKTGRRVSAEQPGSLHVWTYRNRPVYHCARDHAPGDVQCDNFGEFGVRNGFKAFWLRDDFGDLAG